MLPVSGGHLRRNCWSAYDCLLRTLQRGLRVCIGVHERDSSHLSTGSVLPGRRGVLLGVSGGHLRQHPGSEYFRVLGALSGWVRMCRWEHQCHGCRLSTWPVQLERRKCMQLVSSWCVWWGCSAYQHDVLWQL